MIHESEEKDNQTERRKSSKTYLVIQRVIARMCEEKLPLREREREKRERETEEREREKEKEQKKKEGNIFDVI